MGRQYKGNNVISEIVQRNKGDKCYFKIKIQPSQVNLLNKLLEAHTHTLFVAPLRPQEGLVSVYTTTDMLAETERILAAMPIDLEILEQI